MRERRQAQRSEGGAGQEQQVVCDASVVTVRRAPGHPPALRLTHKDAAVGSRALSGGLYSRHEQQAAGKRFALLDCLFHSGMGQQLAHSPVRKRRGTISLEQDLALGAV